MNIKHSKVSQSDLDKFVPAVLFQETPESDKQVEQEQRELERSGRYMQALRNETSEPLTSTQAESLCEQILIVREYNSKLPF